MYSFNLVNNSRPVSLPIEGPTRPYSQNELKDIFHNYLFNMNISNLWVKHYECEHLYCVKFNSSKYHTILSNINTRDIGNCSVCWKINKTKYLLNTELIRDFNNEFENMEQTILNIDNLRLFMKFHSWLY